MSWRRLDFRQWQSKSAPFQAQSVGNPGPVPNTGPRPQFRSPHGPWDGHSPGFRSRAAQEEPPQLNKEETVSMPNKIRKQMKKILFMNKDAFALLIYLYTRTL